MDLTKEEFKEQFFNTVKFYARGPKDKIYKIYSFENRNNWFGVDLRKVKIVASNKYDCWLQLREKLYEKAKNYKGEPYDLYDYDHIIEIALDDVLDENNITMDYIVKEYINCFVQNDTLWCEEQI